MVWEDGGSNPASYPISQAEPEPMEFVTAFPFGLASARALTIYGYGMTAITWFEYPLS